MAGGWSSLPADLLKEVSVRLVSDADHLHARQVCAHWRASISPLSAYRPWVLAGRRGADRRYSLGEYSLHLLRGVRRVDMAAAPPPGLSYCCGARRGWLVLSDDLGLPTRLVLWEPLSGTEIPLPRLRLWPVTQVLISGDPLASSHWMAVAIQRIRADTYALFFWRPGDAAWSEPSGAIPAFAIPSVEFHAGIMYCNTDTSNIFIYNLNLGTSSAPALLQVSELSANEFIHSRRVVACGGQILIVLLFGWPHPSHAEIYMPLTTPRWPFQIGDRVTDLAGYSLFLGDGDAFALPANEFPAIKGSRIHCLKDKVLGLVFDLKTDAVEEIPQLREEDGSISWLPYSWFCPRRPFLED